MTTTETVEPRVDALLAQMTLAEKVGQLIQYFYIPFPGQGAFVDAEVRGGRAGSLLFVADPRETNRLQHLAVEESRLGIPLLFGFDVIHGLRTIFPVPLAMAASWDPALVEQVQTAAAREARAAGIHWAFAPMVDIARDPRWGRIVEGAGEDPYLGAQMAAAQVRGFQGTGIGSPRSTSSPGRSTTSATARRSAGATTTRSASRRPRCATSTCRPSPPRSRPARATS